jgi:hypothetical protein
MTKTAYRMSLVSLKRRLNEYQPQLEKAIAAVKVLQMANPESEAFSDALAELHVCSTVLEPYSEGVREAIDQYTEDLVDE